MEKHADAGATQTLTHTHIQTQHAEVAENSKKNNYSDSDKLEYNCVHGYVSPRKIIYKCSDNKWIKWRGEKCSFKRCKLPEDILNGHYTIESGRNFVFGMIISIYFSSYQMMNDTRTCQDGGWDIQLLNYQLPACEVEGFTDFEELIRYGHKRKDRKKSAASRISMYLQCSKHTIPIDINGFTCEGEQLINVDILFGHPGIVSPYKPGHILVFRCTDVNLKMHGQRTIECLSNGKWDHPYPICGVSKKCGPPPHVNNADTVEMTKKECNTGERVEYMCFNKYTLDSHPAFSKYLTCQQGEWRGNIKCLMPCSVTVGEMDERGIELAFADQQKMFAPHDDHITFKCQRGKVSVGFALRQKCNDGVITLPVCA
uniref:Beta-2-glycoprotein 1 n=1 Tax=Sinocyclocheilus rhinocerous TaxID=307959 RepID=A0A673LQX7_9TELE